MANGIKIKERILTRAEEMFLKSGYSKVTMDKIAFDLGMSKKTLYKFFPSKEELVREIIFKMKCFAHDYIDDIFSVNEMDFIEKLEKLLNLIRILSSKFEGPLLEELYKNIPELWLKINEFRNEYLRQKFTQLIVSGVEKGFFRKDIDHQLIVLICSSAIKGLMNYEILTQIPFSGEQVFENIVKVIFGGFLTKEGRISYNSYQMVS